MKPRTIASTCACSWNVSNRPRSLGVAYPLVRKLLAFNADGVRRVEVVILSRNDPVSGLRVFRSVKGAALGIERGVFTRGRAPFSYLGPLKANLFLSANGDDVRGRAGRGLPGGNGLHPVAGDRLASGGSAHRVRRRRGAVRGRGGARVPGRRGSRRSSITKPIMQRGRCRPARSSRCWRRCIVCSA